MNGAMVSAVLETLESRRMLAAAAAPAGFERITWNGRETFARPDEWIARFDQVSGRAAEQVRQVNERLASRNGFRALRHLGESGVVLLQSPNGAKHDQVTSALRSVRGFRRAEPVFALQAHTTPNDPDYGELWGLNNTAQEGGAADADIDAPEAWQRFGTGRDSGVTAVLDTGVLYTHPDLAQNMWRNPGETPADGVDNDGNGYVDDIFGYDFINHDANPIDDHGHGTHCAGTIAATGNNNVGVTGINWTGKIMALKFLGADGYGDSADAIAALNYATMMKAQYGVDVRVTNNSWGGDDFSQELKNAIAASGAAGMLFVASAGNGGADLVGDDNDATPSYPASYDLANVISVAATDRSDARASFSNFGAASVDLAAPGVAILSTYRGNEYQLLSGTSMAAPHVAGVASLAFSYSRGATAAEVKNAILVGADPIAAMTGKSVSGGRLNAQRALERLPRPGDVDGDGRVNLYDFNLLATNFGSTTTAGHSAGDLNGDGNVNLQDFNLLASYFGR